MIPAEAALSIAISVLAMAVLVWSSIRTRRYKKWNDAMNKGEK